MGNKYIKMKIKMKKISNITITRKMQPNHNEIPPYSHYTGYDNTC